MIKVIQIKPRDRVIEIVVGDEECILGVASRGAYIFQPMKIGLLYLNTSEGVNTRIDHKSLQATQNFGVGTKGQCFPKKGNQQ